MTDLNSLKNNNQPMVNAGNTSSMQISQAKLTEEEMNQMLGIQIPNDVLTEMIPVWQTFLTFLRGAYIDEMMTVEDIKNVYSLFLPIPDIDKGKILTQMLDNYHRLEGTSNLVDGFWDITLMKEEYDEFMATLPPDVRDRIAIYIQTGEDVGDVKEILDYELSLKDEEQQRRLRSLIDNSRGFRVDKDDERASYEVNVRTPGVVSEADLDQRFAVEGYEEYTATPVAVPQPVAPVRRPRPIETINQTSSTSQLSPTPSPSSEVYLPPRANTPSNSINTILPGINTRPKANLDDLLSQNPKNGNN